MTDPRLPAPDFTRPFLVTGYVTLLTGLVFLWGLFGYGASLTVAGLLALLIRHAVRRHR